MITKGLNNTHPFIGYEVGGLGTVLYQNSFDKAAVAGYYKFSSGSSDDLSLNLKVGLTTGYSKQITYEGRVYNLNPSLFLNDKLMMLVVPSVDYRLDTNIEVGVSLLGESINLGITFEF